VLPLPLDDPDELPLDVLPPLDDPDEPLDVLAPDDPDEPLLDIPLPIASECAASAPASPLSSVVVGDPPHPSTMTAIPAASQDRRTFTSPSYPGGIREREWITSPLGKG